MNKLIIFLGLMSLITAYESHGSTFTISQSAPKKSVVKKIIENTSLSYYQQFLGPNLKRFNDSTYNVFLENQAPQQNFHAVNLRYKINQNWAVGVTTAAIQNIGGKVTNQDGTINRAGHEFFNARTYISLPSMSNKLFTTFTTLSYEHPTSNISRDQEMTGGWVIANSYAFHLPSSAWSMGLMSQISRYYFQNNIQAPPFEGGSETPLQTVLVSGGPYINYRINDLWMVSYLSIFDWDQRGSQTETFKFNNNLPDRMRLGLNYYPKMKYFNHIGVFTQWLTRPSQATSVVGMDFSIRL